jgi:hypothetical protein
MGKGKRRREDFEGTARALYQPGSWLSPSDFDAASERPRQCVCGARVQVKDGNYYCPDCDGEEDNDQVEDTLDLIDSLND